MSYNPIKPNTVTSRPSASELRALITGVSSSSNIPSSNFSISNETPSNVSKNIASNSSTINNKKDELSFDDWLNPKPKVDISNISKPIISNTSASTISSTIPSNSTIDFNKAQEMFLKMTNDVSNLNKPKVILEEDDSSIISYSDISVNIPIKSSISNMDVKHIDIKSVDKSLEKPIDSKISDMKSNIVNTEKSELVDKKVLTSATPKDNQLVQSSLPSINLKKDDRATLDEKIKKLLEYIIELFYLYFILAMTNLIVLVINLTFYTFISR